MPLLRSSLLALALIAAAACGGDSKTDPNPPPPVDPGPSSVKILAFQETSNGLATLHLHNDGGPGAFRLEFWALPRSSAGGDTFLAATEAVEVGTGYDESPSYQVRTFFDPPVKYVLAFTRNEGSAVYQQTDRYDVP